MKYALIGMFATLCVMLTIGCVATFSVWVGVAPPFDWRLTPDAQHFLLLHNGPNDPACLTAPLQVDCAWRVPGRGEFYAYYVTPRNGSQLLISFDLPE